MRDWGALVHERLGRLELTPAQQEEIVAELATHLEDFYEEQRAQGLGESQAIERALDEVADGRRLARKIRRAKREEENMNNRTRSLWLPGLVSLTAAHGFLMVFQRAGLQPHIIWLRSGLALMLYTPWLAMMPLFGALGAYLSRRGGGDRLARLTAGLFPSFVMLGLMCAAVLAKLIVDRGGGHFAVAALLGMSFWVVLPGAALLLGALPFLKAPKLRRS